MLPIDTPFKAHVERSRVSVTDSGYHPRKPMTSNNTSGPELTVRQRSHLQDALAEGYFKVPRQISLVELAEKHELSSREASEELRHSIDIVARDISIEDTDGN